MQYMDYNDIENDLDMKQMTRYENEKVEKGVEIANWEKNPYEREKESNFEVKKETSKLAKKKVFEPSVKKKRTLNIWMDENDEKKVEKKELLEKKESKEVTEKKQDNLKGKRSISWCLSAQL